MNRRDTSSSDTQFRSLYFFRQGDVPANHRRTRASLVKRCAAETGNAEGAPRRSGRLSTARVATVTVANDDSVHAVDLNAKKPPAAKRGRSKSVTLKGTTRRKSVASKPAPKDAPKQQTRKRSRSLEIIPPLAARVRARRRSEDYQLEPAKRARYDFLEMSGQEEGLPQEHHNLVLANFEATKYTAGLSPYDFTNRDDVQQSPEYVSDIFQRLFHSEVRIAQAEAWIPSFPTLTRSPVALAPKTCNFPHRYIHKQTNLSASMRAILVDWLVEVHMKFRCVPETLHLAINIIDRYLTVVEIPRQSLQLVGVTAFLLAAKYEEIYPPELHDIVVITDRAYTKQDVLEMEADMLNELSFNLTVPTGYPFLQRFLFITHATKTMANAANYYMERMLQEHDSLQFRPSVIAAAAVCLAINHPEIRDYDEIESEKPGVVSLQQHSCLMFSSSCTCNVVASHIFRNAQPLELLEYTGYSRGMIVNTAEFVAKKVSEDITTQNERELVSVKRKYAGKLYESISTDFESPDAVDIDD